MHSLYLIAAITLNSATAGKVLGEITVVYGLLQIIKKNVPSLTGKWAVVLNYSMSLIGAAIIIPPDSFFSVGTLQVLLLAVIQANGSAGIHGTVQNVAPVALQTVLGQGPKVDAPQVNSASVATIPASGTITNAEYSPAITAVKKPADPYEDILK